MHFKFNFHPFSPLYIPNTHTVITGSTDGIGKQYAFQLASRGLNVVLVSRSTDKLVAVAAEIESKYSVKTKWIAVDFSSGREIYDHLRRELESVPVGILGKQLAHSVTNAPQGGQRLEWFEC